MLQFEDQFKNLELLQQELLCLNNTQLPIENGIYNRYLHPVITANHIPLSWRYDFDPTSNPFLQERIGVNATCNAGAIKWKDNRR